MNRSTYYLFGLFIVVFVAVSSFMPAPATAENSAIKIPNVPFINPQVKVITEYNEYSGRFQAMEAVTVRARVTGYLDKVLFNDGDTVTAGQVLFIIDPRPFMIARDRAKATYELTKQELKRTKILRKTNAVSKQDLDTAEANMKTAKADFDEANLNVEFTHVKSPINGQVSRKKVDIGNLINSGDTILTTVVSQRPIYFYFDISEQDLLHNQSTFNTINDVTSIATLRLQNEKQYLHSGRLTFIDNQLDLSSGTMTVRATFDNADNKLVAGMFGEIKLPVGQAKETILIPDNLVQSNITQKFVYVIDKNNTVIPKNIELGDVYNDNFRIIKSGLSKDDRLVAEGIMTLRPNMTVNPLPKQDKPATK